MVSNAGTDQDRPFTALGFRLVATLILSLIMVLVKLADRHNVPLTQMVFFRQAVPLVLLLGWLAGSRNWHRVRTNQLKVHARRTVTGLVGLFLIMASNQLLPLAEATIYSFTAPFFAVFLAATWLREPVGKVRWLAVAVGLAGVVITISGAAGTSSALGMACAVGGAMCVAITAIQLRDLGRTDSPLVIVFWYFMVTTVAMAIPAIATMPTFDTLQWGLLLGAGFATLFGQLCLTASLRFGHVSSVIVMDYAALGWSTLWGWVIFNQLPPTRAWFGAPLIVAAGLAILAREAQLARRRGVPDEVHATPHEV